MTNKLNSVLLIDDDEGTNYINRKIVENADIAHHIQTTLNGKEAIQYLTHTGIYEQLAYPQPELILLDINMPVMDGWEFLEAYHHLEESQKTKAIIVMLTTSFNPDDKTRAEKNANISGFKYKPLTMEMVNEIMTEHFV